MEKKGKTTALTVVLAGSGCIAAGLSPVILMVGFYHRFARWSSQGVLSADRQPGFLLGGVWYNDLGGDMVKAEVDEEEVELFEYVLLGITQIFTELAEKLSEMDLEADVAAAVPFGLFHAEAHLKTAWARYITDLAEKAGESSFEDKVKALRGLMEERGEEP